MNDLTEREHLIEGMVRDEHEQLWRNNAFFHANIEVLARTVIPAMVRGFAEQATEQAEHQAKALEALLAMPTTLNIPEYLLPAIERVEPAPETLDDGPAIYSIYVTDGRTSDGWRLLHEGLTSSVAWATARNLKKSWEIVEHTDGDEVRVIAHGEVEE